MPLRVLGRKTSINVRKVLWTCAELDLHFEHTDADRKLLARNPNAMVPVIDDDGFVLWESNTICRYLANKQPRDSTLLPSDPQARGLAEQWMDWQATELNTAWRYAFLALSRKSAQHTDAKAIEKSTDSWNEHMRLLDAHVAHSGQLVTGEFFTLADVVLGLSTQRWLLTPMEKPHLDAVHGYYQRLSVRPAFRAQVDPAVP